MSDQDYHDTQSPVGAARFREVSQNKLRAVWFMNLDTWITPALEKCLPPERRPDILPRIQALQERIRDKRSRQQLIDEQDVAEGDALLTAGINALEEYEQSQPATKPDGIAQQYLDLPYDESESEPEDLRDSLTWFLKKCVHFRYRWLAMKETVLSERDYRQALQGPAGKDEFRRVAENKYRSAWFSDVYNTIHEALLKHLSSIDTGSLRDDLERFYAEVRTAVSLGTPYTERDIAKGDALLDRTMMYLHSLLESSGQQRAA